ncbi:MAG: NTP transferase domain-containing protein [Acidimicrobiia bacterium]
MSGPTVPFLRAARTGAGGNRLPRRAARRALQAVILAAGQGCRLNGNATPRPKCLYDVGGVPLLHHQLRELAGLGVHDVVIVVGFQEDRIRRAAGGAARFVSNDRFAETNSLWSFLLARPHVDTDVVIMNSDVYFHPELLTRLLAAAGDALLYDSTSGHDDEHMKVSVRGTRLVSMAKDLPRARTQGENVGMLRLSQATAQAVFDAGEEIVARDGDLSWLAAAVSRVAATRPIECIDVAGLPWVEIDFPEDLHRARTEIYPAVRGPWAQAGER